MHLARAMLQVSWRALPDAEGKAVMLNMGWVGHAPQKGKRSPGAEQGLAKSEERPSGPRFHLTKKLRF